MGKVTLLRSYTNGGRAPFGEAEGRTLGILEIQAYAFRKGSVTDEQQPVDTVYV